MSRENYSYKISDVGLLSLGQRSSSLRALVLNGCDHISDVGLKETIRQFQEDRQGYYERLSTFDTFGRGWTRRVTETTDMAIEMI